MTKRDDQDMERAAYHEAGHAVAFTRAGQPTDVVVLPPTDDGDGGVNSLRIPGLDSPQIVRRYIVGVLAAYAVELKRGVEKEAARRGAASDFMTAESLMLEAETSRGIGYWCARARTFVNRPSNWRAIDAVARELFKRQRLNKLEIVEIICATDGVSLEAFCKRRRIVMSTETPHNEPEAVEAKLLYVEPLGEFPDGS